MNWSVNSTFFVQGIGGIIGALDDAKNALDAIDSSGVLPSSWNKILSRDDTQRKNSILHLFRHGRTSFRWMD